MNHKDVQLSKSLSWLLRHGAIREGFTPSPEGYLEVNKILQHKSFRGKYNALDIERVVNNNDKKRFKLRHNPLTNCLEVKANQGHSISQVTDAELIPITEPKYKTVIHGTYLKCWEKIKNEGISRMKRKHVHLAKGTFDDVSVISGLRRDTEVHIYIDLAKALADSVKFYESENGVILTSGNSSGYLEPKYFIKAINVHTVAQAVEAAPSASSPRRALRHRQHNAQDAQNNAHRIIVSGYPNYTQPQDLMEVFAKFGNVSIDKCNSWVATLSYSTAEEVLAALSANKRLHIYGYYLSVRPHQARGPPGPDHAGPHPITKRDFPMSKQKGVIIEPKQIVLSGDFHSQLDNILAAVRLTQDDVKALSQLYTDLEMALQLQWPGCKAIPFGSITTGLGIKTSDADCFISIPGQFRQPNGNYVNKARRVLMQYPATFAEILAIPRANTPIVKFFHIPTNTNCDVTFKTPLGAQNSRLIAFLLHSDPRLLPMSVMIKYWAKVHDLSGTGKLTNYALTLMIIFYLQQPPLSILPSVKWLQRDPTTSFLVDHWDTGFMNTPGCLPSSNNTSTMSELLGGFLEYYSIFNFDEMVVCPYLGTPVKKDVFKDPTQMSNDFERYRKNVLNNYVMPMRYQTSICVQDPFEQCHNVASTITSKLALDIKTFFKFAANAYEKEKLNSCKEFLKTILLQKPKLIRGKTHPEYRVNLFPRIINTIISFEWKSVVRDIVMEIFENMLKIKLGKVEEKVNPDTRKEKEKYMGSVTKPIWKRKTFSKLYSVINNLTFEERQGKITEEIMNAEKQVINIQFQLTLTYCHDPKSAVISIKLGIGDLDAFREFGKFFISVMQNWFTQLLKPYSMPNCKDTAAKIAETLELDNNEQAMETDDDDDDDEIVLTPKTQEQTVTNNSAATSLHNTQQNSNGTQETLTKDTKVELITPKLNDIAITPESSSDSKSEISVESSTCETEPTLATNDKISTKNVDVLIENNETLTSNIESLIKNGETLQNSVDKDAKVALDVASAAK